MSAARRCVEDSDLAAELATFQDTRPFTRTLAWRFGVREGLHRNPRYAAFFDWEHGILVGEGGGGLDLTPRCPVGELLDRLGAIPARSRPRTVYLTGPDRAAHRPPQAWYEAAVLRGWSLDHWYHSEDRRDGHACDLSCGDERYSLRMAAEWFDDELDPHRCAQTWRQLRLDVVRGFPSGAYIYPTVTATGTYLLQLCLPRAHTYPVLPDGLRRYLQTNSTQGRIEFLGCREKELPGLWCLDARWMYASCWLSKMPAGPWTYDERDDYAPYVPGFYRVTARVPKTWEHNFGLLPVYDAKKKEMTYPRTPGQALMAWASAEEVEIALKCGWVRRIQRRLLWPEWERHGRPLATWSQKLREMRAESANRGDALLAGAYRNLLIRPIGSFHSKGSVEEGFTPNEADIPDDAFASLREGGWAWTRNIERVMPWSHPEWSATIWGRARAHVLELALQLPRDSMVAIRSDGVWVSKLPDNYREFDTGKPGGWRVKESIEHPISAPQNNRQFESLMAEARAK